MRPRSSAAYQVRVCVCLQLLSKWRTFRHEFDVKVFEDSDGMKKVSNMKWVEIEAINIVVDDPLIFS